MKDFPENFEYLLIEGEALCFCLILFDGKVIFKKAEEYIEYLIKICIDIFAVAMLFEGVDFKFMAIYERIEIRERISEGWMLSLIKKYALFLIFFKMHFFQ